MSLGRASLVGSLMAVTTASLALAGPSAVTSSSEGWLLRLDNFDCRLQETCIRETRELTEAAKNLVLHWLCSGNPGDRADWKWQLISPDIAIPGSVRRSDDGNHQYAVEFDLENLMTAVPRSVHLQVMSRESLISRKIEPLKYGPC